MDSSHSISEDRTPRSIADKLATVRQMLLALLTWVCSSAPQLLTVKRMSGTARAKSFRPSFAHVAD
jgi:hypothetical protein